MKNDEMMKKYIGDRHRINFSHFESVEKLFFLQ